MRYTVELWESDGEPNRMPDAVVTVEAKSKPAYGQYPGKAEKRALWAAMSRAARNAGSRGVPFVGTRGFEIDWADWQVYPHA